MSEHLKTTPERSRNMKAVHSKNTKAEVVLEKTLWHKGVRYRKNYEYLPGKPDIALTKYKIAVFVDGEFWHGKGWPEAKKRIHTNREFWIKKIGYNVNHDIQINQQLEEKGWLVLRFWSKDILKNPDYYAELIIWHMKDRG